MSNKEKEGREIVVERGEDSKLQREKGEENFFNGKSKSSRRKRGRKKRKRYEKGVWGMKREKNKK
jgi:hypothetical protein